MSAHEDKDGERRSTFKEKLFRLETALVNDFEKTGISIRYRREKGAMLFGQHFEAGHGSSREIRDVACRME